MTLSVRDLYQSFHHNYQTKTRHLGQWLRPAICRAVTIFGIRPRYVMTRHNKVRLRVVLPLLILSVFGGYQYLNQSEATQKALQAELIQENVAASYFNDLVPAAGESQLAQQDQLINDAAQRLQKKPEPSTAARQTFTQPSNLLIPASFYKKAQLTPKEETKVVKIRSGDTLTELLKRSGITAAEAYKIVNALSQHYNPRSVRAGQHFKFTFTNLTSDNAQAKKKFQQLTMPLSPAKELIVYRTDRDMFRAEKNEKQIQTKRAAARAVLKYSLYGSAAKAGIPDEVIAKMIKIFSWDIDFQRDIRSGDQIEILYEIKQMEDGAVTGYGDILFARLITSGRDIPLYRYELDDGRVDYYSPGGQSIRKTLMRTPVDGARMSSGYGMRRHPILGYNKMHKGADFAAPTGTPIYAAGDGVIERAGRWGGYGNYIRIRHNSKLKTAYAHLHKIKSGIRSGARVKQGQVIGTVGSTGRSTGPHLHYEVLIHDNQVNPRGVNVPTGEELKGHDLRKFKNSINKFDMEFAALADQQTFAEAGDSSDPSGAQAN